VQGSYNENTGNYEDGSPVEEMVMASIMDTKTQTMMQVYGQIKQGSLTCHIQNIYQKSFDYIRIGAKRYKVDYSRRLRTKESFILSEVQ
jgi:hypothetical protein